MIMADYLWHEISEVERKKIQEQAKEIILKFGDMIEKLPSIPETVVERAEFERQEGEGSSCDNDFRDLMFANAPKKDNNCIIAEKGTWIEPYFIHSSKRGQMKGAWVE